MSLYCFCGPKLLVCNATVVCGSSTLILKNKKKKIKIKISGQDVAFGEKVLS
jgi:hypothetical protein